MKRRRLGNVPIPQATEAERRAMLGNLCEVAMYDHLSPAEHSYARYTALGDQDKAARIYAALAREQRRTK